MMDDNEPPTQSLRERSRPPSTAPGSEGGRRSETAGRESNAGRGSDAGSEASTWKRHPPLPAVKGTLGGLDSPRRTYFPTSPSVISTVRGDDGATPNPANGDQNGNVPRPNPNRPVFRADPTMRTCFETLPLDARDELKRLFLLS